jgi:hypothetical protein
VGAWDRLVALGRVEDELAEEFAGGGVDDPDLEVVDQDDDAGSAVGSADADVAESAGDAQGDAAGLVGAFIKVLTTPPCSGPCLTDAAVDAVLRPGRPILTHL